MVMKINRILIIATCVLYTSCQSAKCFFIKDEFYKKIEKEFNDIKTKIFFTFSDLYKDIDFDEVYFLSGPSYGSVASYMSVEENEFTNCICDDAITLFLVKKNKVVYRSDNEYDPKFYINDFISIYKSSSVDLHSISFDYKFGKRFIIQKEKK